MKKIYKKPNMKVAELDLKDVILNLSSPIVSEDNADDDGEGGYSNMNSRVTTTNLWDNAW